MATKNVRVDFKGSKGSLVSVDLVVNAADSAVAIQATAVRKLSAARRKAINLFCTGVEIVDMELPA